ncbi:hypothetical protein VTO73DRAFT_14205 [Trametes versicolor]
MRSTTAPRLPEPRVSSSSSEVVVEPNVVHTGNPLPASGVPRSRLAALHRIRGYSQYFSVHQPASVSNISQMLTLLQRT